MASLSAPRAGSTGRGAAGAAGRAASTGAPARAREPLSGADTLRVGAWSRRAGGPERSRPAGVSRGRAVRRRADLRRRGRLGGSGGGGRPGPAEGLGRRRPALGHHGHGRWRDDLWCGGGRCGGWGRGRRGRGAGVGRVSSAGALVIRSAGTGASAGPLACGVARTGAASPRPRAARRSGRSVAHGRARRRPSPDRRAGCPRTSRPWRRR